MAVRIHRQFEVQAPAGATWNYLADVVRWPEWAGHIKSVALEPPGNLTKRSSGMIRLRNGMKSTFKMVEYRPEKSWKWVGPILWLTVNYDHVFEALDDNRTRITFEVVFAGFASGSVGRLIARIYRGNLDKAIPRLVEKLNDLGSGDG